MNRDGDKDRKRDKDGDGDRDMGGEIVTGIGILIGTE